LRELREERDRLKARLGNQELGQVTSKMDMAEQLAEISDKNRELGRQKIAFERRLDEVEQILSEKDNKLEEAEMARNIYK